MGNMLSFHAFSSSAPAEEFDIFINHRGKDVKETKASLIFHNLQNKGFKVFFDKKSIPVGNNVPNYIQQAIYKSFVHIVIFSPKYVESEWCLNELYWISKTGAPIIPVFYKVRVSEVSMESEDGVYAQTFQMLKRSGKFKSRTLKKWKKTLRDVSNTAGIKLEGDEGELLEQIASFVRKCMERRKSQVSATTDGRWNGCRCWK